MEPAAPDIKGIIFDLDNTLFQYGPRQFELYAVAAAVAALNLGLEKDFDLALKIAQAARTAEGDELAYFVERSDISKQDLMQEFNAVAARRLPEWGAAPGYISVIDGLADRFNGLSPARLCAILTHATQNWASSVLEHIGLAHHFRPDMIFPHDHPDIRHRRKDEAREVFEVVAGRMNLPPKNIAVIENTVENLVIPAEMGMHTVLVTGDEKPERSYPHVRETVNNVTDFLRSQLFPELVL